MTKQMTNDICDALIAQINRASGFDFKKSKDAYSCTFKEMPLQILITIEGKAQIDKISFALKVGNDVDEDISKDELVKKLKLIKDYAANDGKYFECCFCKRLFKGYGNNPAPVAKKGVCCNECNEKIVIPARIEEAK